MMTEYMLLPEVHRRALEVNGRKARDAMDALTTAIAAEDGIRCYSNEILVQESSYCWAFQKYQARLIHNKRNDDDTNRRETEAYRIAYSTSEKPKDVEVILGTNEIFVFTDFEKTEDGSSVPVKIRIWPTIRPKISDDWKSFSFKTIQKTEIQLDTHSRYWRDEVLIILEAKNVICLRADVDRIFPYAVANPTRGKRGRPSRESTIFEYLDTRFHETAQLPQSSKIESEMLDNFARDSIDLPSHSTCMKFIAKWRKQRERQESLK
jgi:hypothetical protein